MELHADRGWPHPSLVRTRKRRAFCLRLVAHQPPAYSLTSAGRVCWGRTLLGLRTRAPASQERRPGRARGASLPALHASSLLPRLTDLARLQMRIKSTYPAFAFLPCLYIAYGWLVYFELHIAGPVIVLFFLGAGAFLPCFGHYSQADEWLAPPAIMVIYASTLAYIVDANPGRSTSAVACNSLFRGVLAVRPLTSCACPVSGSDRTGPWSRLTVRGKPSCRANTGQDPERRLLQRCVVLSALTPAAKLTISPLDPSAGWGILLLLGEGALVVVAIRGGKWRAASRASEARDAARRRERDEKRLGRIGSGEKR